MLLLNIHTYSTCVHIHHSVSDGHLDMPTAITFTSGTTTSVTRPNDPEEDEHTPTSNPITVNSTAPNHVTEPSETPEGSSGPTHTTEEEVTPSPPR